MNQDEILTREDITSQYNSVLKIMIKDTDDHIDKLNKKKSKYSQSLRKDSKPTKPLLQDKKRVKFKDRIEDVVLIESFKAYNQKMCFDDYKDTMVTTKRSCCEDSKCVLF
jgi:hypothetical protein